MIRRQFIIAFGALLVLVLLLVVTASYLVEPREEAAAPDVIETDTEEAAAPSQPVVEVVAAELDIPWDIAFLPDGTALVTERSGSVVHLESGRAFPISGIAHVGEAGLLGIALHPDFAENTFVYLYETTDRGDALENRVIRYTYTGDELVFDRVIYSGIPGARYHDGGRIAFGPDRMLYITVGDAGDAARAQDPDTLHGTILRLNDDGTVPEDNPFGTSVYSYGHRNPQGLAWDAAGRLWSTEHGRSGVRSGLDEINLIVPGGNYGWPQSEGDTVLPGTIAPALHSTADVTWAPASAHYHNGSLFFGGLRGETLYEAVLDGEEVVALREHIVGEFGRIRTVQIGPDGFLYITTSNRDGRGSPAAEDDRIIRIDPASLE